MSFAAFLQTVSAKLVLSGVDIVILCVIFYVHVFDLCTLGICFHFLSRVHTLTAQREEQQSPLRILRNEPVSHFSCLYLRILT